MALTRAWLAPIALNAKEKKERNGKGVRKLCSASLKKASRVPSSHLGQVPGRVRVGLTSPYLFQQSQALFKRVLRQYKYQVAVG